jgi:hypothetical protein
MIDTMRAWLCEPHLQRSLRISHDTNLWLPIRATLDHIGFVRYIVTTAMPVTVTMTV